MYEYVLDKRRTGGPTIVTRNVSCCCRFGLWIVHIAVDTLCNYLLFFAVILAYCSTVLSTGVSKYRRVFNTHEVASNYLV